MPLTFRKALFWAHLACGILVGMVVLMMSVTGVLLTYERQIISWADRNHYRSEPSSANQQQPGLDELLAQTQKVDFQPSSITLLNDPSAAVVFQAGRGNTKHVNPYTGETVEPGNKSLHSFFSTITRIHRWFNLGNENREYGQAITGASNLIFLFIVLSGLYLWLPQVFEWTYFKRRLWFRGARTAPARDFNWHHVFGIWAAIPLIIIISTATVFGYSWANDLVYQVVGEEAPKRGRRPQSANQAPAPIQARQGLAIETLKQKALVEFSARESAPWNSLTIDIGKFDAAEMTFNFDTGTGGEPQKRQSLSLDTLSGEVTRYAPFESQSTGRQLRSWIRYLHTGEALGVIGQTIAGLASLAAVFMVWTGFSLSYRRLKRYLNKQRRFAAIASQTTNT